MFKSVLALVALSSSVAMADLRQGQKIGGGFTVMQIQECQPQGPIAVLPSNPRSPHFDDFAREYSPIAPPVDLAWSCGTKMAVGAGLKATSITFHMIGMCSLPVNPGVTVVMEASGLMLNIVDFGISYIPCEEDQQAKAEEFCRLLEAQGIACDPSKAVFQN